MCLVALSESAANLCRVTELCNRQRDKLTLPITEGSQINKKLVTDLLTTLGRHSCKKCVGGQWAKQVLEEYKIK